MRPVSVASNGYAKRELRTVDLAFYERYGLRHCNP